MTAERQILFLHNDDLVARALASALKPLGITLSTLALGDYNPAQSEAAEGILIDSSAHPDSLCPRLRDDGAAAPILGLMFPQDPECPALDDRMDKPIRAIQLASRLRNLLDRPMPQESVIPIAHLQLHPLARAVVTEDDRRIALTEKETAILLHLNQAEGRPVGREELLDQVWGYAAGASTHTVETHIYRLRHKLGEAVLLTENDGYRLANSD